MWLYIISFLLCFLNITYALSERERLTITCKENTVHVQEQALRNDLFKSYDTTSQPCINQTIVDFNLYLRAFEFIEMSNTFELHGVLTSYWVDERLMWDKQKFNITGDEIYVSASDIWTPDITLQTSGELSMTQQSLTSQCIVRYNGGVLCKSHVVYTVICHTDYTAWPHDIHYCDIQIGSWAYDSSILNFTSQLAYWAFIAYTPNPGWDIIYNHTGTTYTKNKYESENPSYMLWTQIVLKRHGSILEATYITPAIAFVIFTLTVLWLEIKSLERLILACNNFICHLLCIQNLQWRLPPNGQEAPLILLFYEKSLILAAFALLLTVSVCKLEKLKKEAPKFLTSITTHVLTSGIGRILFVNILDPRSYVGLKEDSDDTNYITPRKDQSWTYLSILIGWLSLTGVSITYIVMLIMYIPSDSSNYNVDFFEMRLRNSSKNYSLVV